MHREVMKHCILYLWIYIEIFISGGRHARSMFKITSQLHHHGNISFRVCRVCFYKRLTCSRAAKGHQESLQDVFS